MCGKGLKDNGFDVAHIMSDDKKNAVVETQADLEKRLLEIYVKPLFIDCEKADVDIEESYKKQNILIGYKLGEDD
jgi:hypothetical protein